MLIIIAEPKEVTDLFSNLKDQQPKNMSLQNSFKQITEDFTDQLKQHSDILVHEEGSKQNEESQTP